MGLIREALRAPRLDGQEAEAEACILRLIDGHAIGIAVPYETVTRMIFGNRPLTGAPRGMRYDEKHGWIELRPPACDPEDEGVFPLTAISAIVPLYSDDLDAVAVEEMTVPADADANGHGSQADSDYS